MYVRIYVNENTSIYVNLNNKNVVSRQNFQSEFQWYLNNMLINIYFNKIVYRLRSRSFENSWFYLKNKNEFLLKSLMTKIEARTIFQQIFVVQTLKIVTLCPLVNYKWQTTISSIFFLPKKWQRQNITIWSRVLR